MTAASQSAVREYQICRRCIMDTSDPGIVFDDAGICGYCRIYDKRISEEVYRGEEGRRRLDAIVARLKDRGRHRAYDCVAGVSGGVDSTMAVWLLKKLGLRVLAVHLDNGWDSELAVDNIKKTLDALEIDLHTTVLDWDEFRDLQLSFLRASVPNCEIPTDHAIVAANFRAAIQHRISSVVIGSNIATEAFVPTEWAYDARDLRHLRAIHRRFGTIPLRTFPTLSVLSSLHAVFVRRIRWLSILNYVDYRKAETIELLRTELGWRPYGGKHYESVYTRFYQGYILKKKFGFDKARAHLANLVLSGEMTREAALAELSREPYIGTRLWADDREFVIKKLGLTDVEFEALMAAAPKRHYDYPTNRFIYEQMPTLFGFLKRVATRL